MIYFLGLVFDLAQYLVLETCYALLQGLIPLKKNFIESAESYGGWIEVWPDANLASMPLRRVVCWCFWLRDP